MTTSCATDQTATPRQESPPAMNAVIDEINCNPEQAEWIHASPAVCDNFVSDAHRRFSEVLYRNAEGCWYLARPLAPDEAREWLEHPHHDHVLAQRFFPPRAR